MRPTIPTLCPALQGCACHACLLPSVESIRPVCQGRFHPEPEATCSGYIPCRTDLIHCPFNQSGHGNRQALAVSHDHLGNSAVLCCAVLSHAALRIRLARLLVHLDVALTWSTACAHVLSFALFRASASLRTQSERPWLGQLSPGLASRSGASWQLSPLVSFSLGTLSDLSCFTLVT